MFCYIWEFQVNPDQLEPFLQHYGAQGSWIQLFKKSAGYGGTRLVQDIHNAERFLTIDQWRSEAEYRAFRQNHAAEFDALDEQCEHFTRCERHLGDFTEIL